MARRSMNRARRLQHASAAPRRVDSPATPTSATPASAPTAGPSQADLAVQEGKQRHQAGRLAEAEAHYRRALSLHPTHADALHLLGLIAYQVGQHEQAVQLIGAAIKRANANPAYYADLGAALQALGRLDVAAQSYRAAITLRAEYPDAWNNLGVALQAQGDLTEAIPCFEQAIALAPAYAEARLNLGLARQTEGRTDLAVACFEAALSIRPGYVAARYNLGNAHKQLGRLDAAVAAYRAVIEAAPNHADALNNLGVALSELGELREAATCFEQTIALQPAYTSAHVNLGHLLRQRGQFDEAINTYRQVLAVRPDDDAAHSNLILALDHHPACTPALAFAERRAWNATFAAAATAAAPPATNTPDPHRRLRVGYVSTNFARNSNSLAFVPILAHDPHQFEVVCYGDVAQPDAQTRRYASQTPLWRDVHGWSHAKLAEQVRADQIDILVDLDGHASHTGRLRMFALKPAPIQVTGWGYPTATGLDAMDALLADAVVIPPDEHRWFRERVVNLPTMMCLDVPPQLPDLAALPAAERGFLTFGCFNQPMKVSTAVLNTWAAILAQVSDARIVFKYTGMDDPEQVARIHASFAARGVGPERIDILGRSDPFEHLAAYNLVDVQLDPFPHGGGVTTYDGLLMGVPCVTLYGDRLSGRVSASFLTALGLTDLIASTLDAYHEIAVRVAQEVGWLAQQRATLRSRVLASPIADRAQYTRAAEAAYRELWQEWCARR